MPLVPDAVREMFVAFVEQFAGVPLEEFLRLCPHPFLLLESSPDTAATETAFQTAKSDYSEPTLSLSPAPRGRPAPDTREMLVPLVGKDRSPAHRALTVGRHRENDVVLPFEQVSKFHAFLAPGEAGRCWTVEDGGSRNGTYVNNLRLGKGEMVEITPGDVLDFGGGLPFTFFLSEGLHPYLPVLARRFRARAKERDAEAQLPQLREGTARIG